ncbi:MAG TPA: hypothetical protein VMR75_03750 [Candidatus Saccharimonadales bacterium]|nr:hypothetical protein [Candidatus Saccharimonadales bacterium]
MNDEPENKQPTKGKGYGKRPMWQWILLYVVVAAILYYIIYLLFFHHTGGSTTNYSY